MTFKGEKVTEINMAYNMKIKRNHMSLNIGFDGHSSDTVYANNWKVCRIDEIGDLIQELTILKETIEGTAGVIL